MVDVSALGETGELTGPEKGLMAFSVKLREALAVGADGEEEKAREGKALQFFMDREAEVVVAAGDETRLPWEVLHVAEIALEVSTACQLAHASVMSSRGCSFVQSYALLDLAVENRLDELAATRPKDYSRQIKRLKAFRASAGQALRAVGAKVTAYGKQVAKARPKVVANLAELRQFPLVSARMRVACEVGRAADGQGLGGGAAGRGRAAQHGRRLGRVKEADGRGLGCGDPQAGGEVDGSGTVKHRTGLTVQW